MEDQVAQALKQTDHELIEQLGSVANLASFDDPSIPGETLEPWERSLLNDKEPLDTSDPKSRLQKGSIVLAAANRALHGLLCSGKDKKLTKQLRAVKENGIVALGVFFSTLLVSLGFATAMSIPAAAIIARLLAGVATDSLCSVWATKLE